MKKNLRLATWNYIPNVVRSGPSDTVIAWRRSLNVGVIVSKERPHACLSIDWEVLHRNESDWRQTGTDYYSLCLTKYFKLGEGHTWYDGPHCSFSLGWLHLSWCDWTCRKCESGEFLEWDEYELEDIELTEEDVL